jgi:hypothetical protein
VVAGGEEEVVDSTMMTGTKNEGAGVGGATRWVVILSWTPGMQQ